MSERDLKQIGIDLASHYDTLPTDDPLDGDEVDVITTHFRNYLNLTQGNITQFEYDTLVGKAKPEMCTVMCGVCNGYRWRNAFFELAEGGADEVIDLVLINAGLQEPEEDEDA